MSIKFITLNPFLHLVISTVKKYLYIYTSLWIWVISLVCQVSSLHFLIVAPSFSLGNYHCTSPHAWWNVDHLLGVKSLHLNWPALPPEGSGTKKAERLLCFLYQGDFLKRKPIGPLFADARIVLNREGSLSLCQLFRRNLSYLVNICIVLVLVSFSVSGTKYLPPTI